MLGARSSAFRIRVHFFVQSRTAPRMSLAMSRRRSVFFAIALLLHVALSHDRGLSAVGVGDPRTCEVQNGDDGLSSVGAGLGQDGLEPLAASSKLSERTPDAGRPIDS